MNMSLPYFAVFQLLPRLSPGVSGQTCPSAICHLGSFAELLLAVFIRERGSGHSQVLGWCFTFFPVLFLKLSHWNLWIYSLMLSTTDVLTFNSQKVIECLGHRQDSYKWPCSVSRSAQKGMFAEITCLAWSRQFKGQKEFWTALASYDCILSPRKNRLWNHSRPH